MSVEENRSAGECRWVVVGIPQTITLSAAPASCNRNWLFHLWKQAEQWAEKRVENTSTKTQMQIKAPLFDGRNACFNLTPELAPEIYWTLNYAVCWVNLRPRVRFVYAMVMNLENFCTCWKCAINLHSTKRRLVSRASERSGGCEVLIQLLLVLVLWSLTRRQLMTPAPKLNWTRLHLIFHANSSIKTWRKSTNRIGLSVSLSVARPRSCRAVKWRERKTHIVARCSEIGKREKLVYRRSARALRKRIANLICR